MESPYACMKLYLGRCDSRGCPEGRFYPDKPADPRLMVAANRREVAFKMVWEAIDLDKPEGEFWERKLSYGKDMLVKNETEAKQMIKLVSNRYPGSSDRIELDMCMHGRLRFYRVVDIPGIGVDKRDELIKVIDGLDHPRKISQLCPYIRKWMFEFR